MSSQVRSLACKLLMAALICLAAANAGRAEEKTATFAAQLRARFPAWAKERTSLELRDVTNLLKDRRVKGDDAAALAAIHHHFQALQKQAHREKKQLLVFSVTQDELLAKDAVRHLEKDYREYRTYLATVPRELFADKHAPTLEGVAQGHLGDCYLLSTIAALVQHHPKKLRDMIHDRGDGSYDITFLDGRKFHVPVVTDGMIVLGARAGRQGLWLNVLETAYGYHRLEQGVPAGELPEDTLNGGWAGNVMKLFTGRAATSYAIPRKEVDRPATEEKIRKLIAAKVKAKALMTLKADPGHPGDLPPRIIGHHVYAVLDFDASTDRVKIWNPWGAHLNFHPKGADGLKHGYMIKNGVFEVPIREFSHVFWRIDYDDL